MRATGLEKGGIYNHFTSKEQLALEAFDYAYELVAQRTRQALNGKAHAIERLAAIVSVFEGLVATPLVAGGCPILNSAIEADDANEPLRARAAQAMDNLRVGTVCRIVQRGIERGEIRADVDADEVASVLVALLEGAVMLSNLYKDPVHMRRAASHCLQYIATLRPGAQKP
jgi:AcrR family transcriptional regulator